MYIEPLMAINGAVITHFNPTKFLSVMSPAAFTIEGTPSSLSSSAPVLFPAIQILLSSTASLYLLFGLNEGIVLRLTNDLNVWSCVGYILCSVMWDIFMQSTSLSRTCSGTAVVGERRIG